MSWAEVKKINSNLDVPLDKLIKSQRILGASNAVMAVIQASEIDMDNDEQTVGTFTPKVNGSVRILGEMTAEGQYSVGYIRIYNSAGTEILEIMRRLTDDNSTQNCDTDFSVNANETYTIKTKSTYPSTYLNYLKIGATVIDGSMLDYTTTVIK